MVIQDCYCTARNGRPNPACAVCDGTGKTPLTPKQIEEVFMLADLNKAEAGDLHAMIALGKRGVQWKIKKTPV